MPPEPDGAPAQRPGGPQDGADMPPDPVNLVDAAAGFHRAWFEAWCRQGFPPAQALYLLAMLIQGQQHTP